MNNKIAKLLVVLLTIVSSLVGCAKDKSAEEEKQIGTRYVYYHYTSSDGNYNSPYSSTDTATFPDYEEYETDSPLSPNGYTVVSDEQIVKYWYNGSNWYLLKEEPIYE